MNYIRTKDNKLFRVIKDLTYENTYHLESKAEMLTIMTEEKYLSTMGKIADTIEELCDELVLTDDKGKKHYSSVEGNIFYIGAIVYKNSVRGAIWTDKGLIYVAKMNDKGELELL